MTLTPQLVSQIVVIVFMSYEEGSWDGGTIRVLPGSIEQALVEWIVGDGDSVIKSQVDNLVNQKSKSVSSSQELRRFYSYCPQNQPEEFC